MTSFPTPKYAIGDRVWKANTVITRKMHPCPDCLGKGRWAVTSPAGGQYTTPCPRCGSHYQSNPSLSLYYSSHEPIVEKLTIGSVRINTEEDEPVTYMCRETGVGSGQVHGESALFDIEDDARAAAVALCEDRNKVDWIAKQYDASLQLCDFQIENAALKSARDEANHSRAKVQILFEDLRDCETLDQVKERLDEGLGQ